MINPVSVAFFVHWLYTQQVIEVAPNWSSLVGFKEEDDRVKLGVRKFDICIKAYVFGGRFLAHTFRRAVNNLFTALMTSIWILSEFKQETVPYASNNVPSDHVLLQWLVDNYCRFWNACPLLEIFKGNIQQQLPPCFLFRVTRSHRDGEMITQASGIRDYDRCYQEHADETEQKACGKKHMMYNEEDDHEYFN
jgi:hypothetical protein